MRSRCSGRFFCIAIVLFIITLWPPKDAIGNDAPRDIREVAAAIIEKQAACKAKPPPADCDKVLQDLHQEILKKTCAVTARSDGCGAVLLRKLNEYVKTEWMADDAAFVTLDDKAKAVIIDLFHNIFHRVNVSSLLIDELVGELKNRAETDIASLRSAESRDTLRAEWARALEQGASWYRTSIEAVPLSPVARKEQNATFGLIGKHVQAVLDATADPPKPGARTVAAINGLSAVIATDKPTDQQLADVPIDRLIEDLRAYSQLRTGVEIVGAWYGDVARIRSDVAARVKAQLPAWDFNRRFPSDVLTLDVATFSKMPGSIGDRFCSAEGPVRVNCQGRPACYARKIAEKSGQTAESFPNGDPSQINPDALCGFDPVPLSDPAVRGLVILYRCSTLSRDGWERIQIDPNDRRKDPSDPKVPSTAAPIREIVLRNGVANEIRCALEDDAVVEAKK